MQVRHGLVTQNVTPLRALPDSESECVSQAILGEPIVLLEEQEEWVRVETPDAYRGWIRSRHARPLSVSESERPGWPFDGPSDSVYRVASGIVDLLPDPEGPPLTKLVLGTWVRRLGAVEAGGETYVKVAVPLGADGLVSGYLAASHLQAPEGWRKDHAEFNAERVCQLALRFVGTPYLWGGVTPFGFDCSGFVQRLYRMQGVLLPRDAHQQAVAPRGVSLNETAPRRAGDLLFLTRATAPERGIVHVGMVLDEGRYVHAAGDAGVTVSAFDDPHYRRRYAFHSIWRYTPPA